jgi:hypothetical protein
VNATGGEDGTALLRAELQRRMEIAELLMKHDEGGTTVRHITSADDTPLQAYCSRNQNKVFLLVRQKPNPVESEEALMPGSRWTSSTSTWCLSRVED